MKGQERGQVKKNGSLSSTPCQRVSDSLSCTPPWTGSTLDSRDNTNKAIHLCIISR
uniref:Uncharacterized protein n=1 Tax=Aegilops tauschii subsp. strangulata TaxID=200361 RepID=A0A453A684_AEGTS